MKTILRSVIAATLMAVPAITALTIPATAHAHDLDDDDAKRDVKVDYDFSGFDKIEVTGVFLLDIQQGETFSVRTEARKKDMKWLNVRVEGDTLVLGVDEDEEHSKRVNKRNKGVLAVVTMPRLETLTVAGIATGHVDAFTGGDVEIEVAGIGDLELSGTCDRLRLEFAGMGDVDARDLKCSDVEAELGGMGALTVYASESVDASIGGMGSIDVYGDPKDVDTDKTMFSSINIK